MADYYTQFSEALHLESDDERQWAEKKLTELRNGYVETGDEEQFPGNFEWAVHQDRDTGRWHVWFHEEESGTPEHVAAFVQEFLKRWRPKGTFSLTWASICSKPRLSSFSGGGVLVTATKQTWVVPEDMIAVVAKESKPRKRK